MNVRTVSQMNDHIARGLSKVPHDIELVVGVPRSGMLPATILSLHLDKALTDVDGLLAGRIMRPGNSERKPHHIKHVLEARKILVIDDSCSSGSQLRAVRSTIARSGIEAEMLYAAVYVAPRARKKVDLYFDICPTPRIFEWNWIHHPHLRKACIDFDGVLCCDPTDEENDDGPRYLKFLDEAAPLWIPTRRVGWLVTARLEKYRRRTEAWLARHGVRYGELVMLDIDSAAERRRMRCHARFKAEVYRSRRAGLFIESDPSEAAEIAELSRKTVWCISNQQIYAVSGAARRGKQHEGFSPERRIRM